MSTATQANVINLFGNAAPSQEGDIKALALELKLQKEYQKALKEQLEKINAEITSKEETLYDLMVSTGIKKMNYAGIGSVSPQLQYWASITGETQEKGFEQLRALELGDLIQEKVNGQTLSAQIRTMIDDGEIVQDDIEWIFKNGPLQGQVVKMKISGKKKVNIRKG